MLIEITREHPVATYGHRLGWAVLGTYTLVGLAARWLLNRIEALR